ncbi:MAG: hypothetical protein M3O36_13420, partial [Myxococcota bacterium]|nr:hypothetical protein [Myxococcota bacterium]
PEASPLAAVPLEAPLEEPDAPPLDPPELATPELAPLDEGPLGVLPPHADIANDTVMRAENSRVFKCLSRMVKKRIGRRVPSRSPCGQAGRKSAFRSGKFVSCRSGTT